MNFLYSMLIIFAGVLIVFLIVLIVYCVLLNKLRDKTKGHYTIPAWNFSLKRVYAKNKVIKQQNKHKKKSVKRVESEEPKVLPNEESTDCQQISGDDDLGNSLLIKFTRQRHRVAEVWLLLRLANGQVYTLPNQPNTSIVNSTPRVFEAAGLKLECLVPFGKWRITFSGILRRGIAQNESQQGDLFYSKINFIWVAASDPSFWPYDWSAELIAKSLATEKCRDGKWLKSVLLKDSGGYDQFGACHGQVKVYESDSSAYVEGLLPKSDDFELNLPGMRKRRWGPNYNDQLHRTAVLMGSIRDGVVFEVGAISGKTGLTHTQFGNLRFPDGRVVPIESTDFHLAAMAENPDHLPQATIVKMTADGKDFEAMIDFKNKLKVPFYGGSQKENWNAFVIPIAIKFNKIEGLGAAIFWYPKNTEKFDIQENSEIIERIYNPQNAASPEKLLVSFNEKEAQSVLVSGGKGSSLAILNAIQEMNQRKYNASEYPEYFVPEGFNVSVSAFERHLQNNPTLKNILRDLEDIAYGKTSGSLQDACARVQEAFVATNLDRHLTELISDKLKLINLDGSERFAARSSGVTEDCEESSAAGQNETFLGLKTDEDVFKAIVKCWASLYGYQSVQYRKQNIQPIQTTMSVVVQRMVPAEAAGVLFTRHPVNGDIGVTIITANYGLGESVVSAKSEPDTFYIKRTISDKLEFLGSKAGAKKMITVMDSEASIQEIDLPENKRSQLCLSEETCLKLARLGVIMEKYFGTARDLEFAVTKDDKIYLLQSRPITALNSFTEYEIINENNTAIMSPNDSITKAMAGEVILGSCSVFTQSVLIHILEQRIGKNVNGSERKPGSIHNLLVPIFHQSMFVDLGKVFFPNIGSSISLRDRVLASTMFGCDIYEKYPQLFDLAQHHNSFQSENSSKLGLGSRLYAAFFKADKNKALMAATCRKVQTQFHRENIRKLTAPIDILDFIEKGLEDLSTVTNCHMVASNAGTMPQMISFSIILGNSKTFTIEAQNDIASILSSISNIESANVPEMIQEIANKMIASKRHEEFLKVNREESYEWLKENCNEVFQQFEDFLQRHGHRTINELDFISTPWIEEPEVIIDMIKANLKSASLGSVEVTPKSKTSNSDIVRNLKSPLGFFTKFLLRNILLPRCQKGVQDREDAKNKWVIVINEIRQATKYLAERMVGEGILPDKSLIFNLSPMEIRDLINFRDARLVQKAIRRQRLTPKLNELKFAEVSFGVPKPLENTMRDANFTAGDVLVSGVPVCSGIVTGRACVCKSFADAVNLQKGDILITYGTDIGWSPYFPILSGICTEIGGLISHGAVVAREFSLPCIVGATFATDIIKDGQQITLNASNGTIYAA